MAKVIEFYVPKNFRNPSKEVPHQLGKVLDFGFPKPKSFAPFLIKQCFDRQSLEARMLIDSLASKC